MEQFEGLYEEEEENLFKNVKKERFLSNNKKFINNDVLPFPLIDMIAFSIWMIIFYFLVNLYTFFSEDTILSHFIMVVFFFGFIYFSIKTSDFFYYIYYYINRQKSINKINTLQQNQKVQLFDSELGPYLQIFDGKDAYYDKKTNICGNENFLLKNHEFNNVEIFLERPEILIGVGKRSVFNETEQYFIDIINKETQKVKRLFVQELNYIYNTSNEIVISRKNQYQFDIVHFNINTLEENKVIYEESVAFFKIIYNKTSNTWGKLYYNFIKSGGFFKYEELILTNQDFVFESFDKETHLINSKYNVLNI